MKEFTYTIGDPLGIHARPAGLLTKAAKVYNDTTVTITKAGKSAAASQLMKLKIGRASCRERVSS